MQDSHVQARVAAMGVRDAVADLHKAADAVDQVGKRMRSAADDMKAAKNGWTSFKEDFTKGFNISVGVEAFELAKDSVVNFVASAITGAASYEQSMNVLAESSHATAAELAQLKQVSRDLGADVKLPGTSARDATEAMLELNKAGLDLNDTMSASRGVLELSAAAQVDNAKAAEITANTLNTFSLAGSEATRIADLMAAGANSSSASITDLADGVKQAGFAFAGMNQSVEDMVTAVAALTNVGLTGSDAGTALKNAMLQLAAPTQEASKLMDRLGINVRGANGEMLPFPLLIEELRTKLEDLSPAERDAALKTMLLSDGMKAMLPLISMGEQEFAKLKSRVMEQGAAARMAEAQNKGLAGAIDAFGSAMETLQISVLEPLLPVMTNVMNGLSTTIGWISENGIPIITGVTAATAAWAVMNGTTLVTSLGAAGVAMKAFLVSAGPLIAIGATVGALAYAFNELTDSATAQSLAIRDQSEAYNEAVTAVEEYRLAQENAALAFRGMADDEAAELERLTALWDEKEARATGRGTWNYIKAGIDNISSNVFGSDVNQRQIDELVAIQNQMNGLRSGIEKTTDTTLKHNEAARANEEAMRLSREGYINYANVTQEQSGKMAAAFTVTEEQAEAARKELERLGKEGPKAMNEVLNTTTSFLSERENAQAAHEASMAELYTTGTQQQIDEAERAHQAQELSAATSYANQQAAHRAHLGVMLIDWINAQAMTDAAFAEKSGELIQAISAQYGIVADVGQLTWGDQLNAIRAYVDGSVPSIEDLMTTLDQNEQQAVETKRAMEALQGEYITEVQTRYDKGELSPEEYAKELEKIPSRVHTEIMAEGDKDAAAAASRTQAVYDRMDRKIETELLGDSTNAVDEATKATNAVNDVPDSHTTELHVDGSSVRPEAESAANEILDGFSQTIANGAWRAAAATRSMAIGAIAAARQALDSRSPSREFGLIGDDVIDGLVFQIQGRDGDVRDTISRSMQTMVSTAQQMSRTTMPTTGQMVVGDLVRGLQTGAPQTNAFAEQMIDDLQQQFKEREREFQEYGEESIKQFASGIRRSSRIPAEEYEETLHDIGKAVRDYYDDQADLTRDHVSEVLDIWREYYAERKAATDAFNSDKFDQQYDFFDRIAQLDEADRAASMQRQQAAWNESQEIAQSGRADVADEYYRASLAMIDADQQRAGQIKGIEQDIVDTKKRLAEETDATRRAELEAQIYELESRKAYLEDLDRMRDERDASELERIKNQESAIAEERDAALLDENQRYQEAQTRLANDFNTTIDTILGAEDRLLQGHLDMAGKIINSYESIAAAAIAAGQSSTRATPDGSHSQGMNYVPYDGYIAELHEGERVQTREQAAAAREFEQQMNLEIQTSSPATNSGMQVQAPAEQPPIVVNFYDTVVRDNTDIDVIVEKVFLKAKRNQRR